jgi:hypothetical protein
MSTVLDYSDYVEMLCRESDGTYNSEPSLHDVKRSAHRFPLDREPNVSPQASRTTAESRELDALVDFQDWRHSIFGPWYHINECPCCNHTLKSQVVPPALPRFSNVSLRLCPNCGWWDTEEQLHAEYPDPSDSTHYEAFSIHRRALLREFDVDGSDVPLTALRRHILAHPRALHQLDPHRLERLVESVFKDFMACEAVHLGGPNDGGVDLVLINGSRRYVVQVKRRQSPTTAESVSCVREFVGAMVIAGETRGMFVSTAPFFSRQAIRDSEVAKSRGAVEYLELINGRRLLEVCEIAAVREIANWQRALTDEDTLLEHINTGRTEFLDYAFGPRVPGNSDVLTHQSTGPAQRLRRPMTLDVRWHD